MLASSTVGSAAGTAARHEPPWRALTAAASLHAVAVAALILWPQARPSDAAPIVVSLEFVTPAEPPPSPSPPEPEVAAAPPPEPVPAPPPEPPPRKAEAPKPKPKPAPPRTPEALPAPPVPAITAAPALPAPPAPRTGTSDPSYAAILLRWLERFRDYPRHARLRGIEGTVILSLTLKRSGSVAAVKIHAGSGHAVLDDAALAMARNADPFPPLPRTFALDGAEFLVPVVFALQ